MAKDKNSFTAYCDWQETFKSLPDDKAGKLIKHLFAYVNDENPETDDIIINVSFAQIKATLKRDLKKWEAKRDKNKQNAFMRWNKSNANACERINTNANYAVSDSVSVSVSDIINNINELDFEPIFMQLNISPDLIEKYRGEFIAKVMLNDEIKTYNEAKTWLINWLKLQPKINFKYLTDTEKERKGVPKEWDYIYYEDTYKRLYKDEEGCYVKIGTETIRL